MKTIKEELKKSLNSNYSIDSNVECAMKIIKKHMIETIQKTSEFADKRGDGYARFIRSVSSMIADINKL